MTFVFGDVTRLIVRCKIILNFSVSYAFGAIFHYLVNAANHTHGNKQEAGLPISIHPQNVPFFGGQHGPRNPLIGLILYVFVSVCTHNRGEGKYQYNLWYQYQPINAIFHDKINFLIQCIKGCLLDDSSFVFYLRPTASWQQTPLFGFPLPSTPLIWLDKKILQCLREKCNISSWL